MQKSQNRVTYQASTTWCLGKGTQRKRIPRSQPQRSTILKSSSARSTRTTLISQQQPLLPSIPRHQWLDQRSSSPPNESEDDQQKDVLQSASSEATRKASKLIWFSKTRSRRIAGDLSPWRSVREPTFGGLVICSSSPKLNSTLFQPSPFSYHKSWFFLLWRFFHRQYLHLWSFDFLPQSLPYQVGRFFIDWSLVRFSSPVFLIGLGGFSPATWPFETHQLFYGARMFSEVLRFSSSVSLIGLGGFSPSFHSLTDNFHAQRSLRLRRKANVMAWLRDLPITWSWHVTNYMICSYDPNTWEPHPDIKSSSIPTSASSLPGHDYIRIPHLSYDYYIFSRLVHRLSESLEPGAQTRKTIPKLMPGPDLVVVM